MTIFIRRSFLVPIPAADTAPGGEGRRRVVLRAAESGRSRPQQQAAALSVRPSGPTGPHFCNL